LTAAEIVKERSEETKIYYRNHLREKEENVENRGERRIKQTQNK
jgi:hypothetical protein